MVQGSGKLTPNRRFRSKCIRRPVSLPAECANIVPSSCEMNAHLAIVAAILQRSYQVPPFFKSWLLGKRKADAPPESTCFFSGCRRGSRHQATCEPCLLKTCSRAILRHSHWRESQSKPRADSRPRRNILSDTTRDRVRLMKAKPSKPDQLLNDSYRESPQITAALKVASPDK